MILFEGEVAPLAPIAAAGIRQGTDTVANADRRKARRVVRFMAGFPAFAHLPGRSCPTLAMDCGTIDFRPETGRQDRSRLRSLNKLPKEVKPVSGPKSRSVLACRTVPLGCHLPILPEPHES